jgi:hypothetical protein
MQSRSRNLTTTFRAAVDPGVSGAWCSCRNAFLLLVLGSAAGCEASARNEAAEAAIALPDGLRPVGAVTLEETDAVINVGPRLVLDPAGGFLVSDWREGQIRRYTEEGALVWNAGRRGGGPGEFTAPGAIARQRNGEVLVLDRHERITIFSSDAARVSRVVTTPFRRMEDVVVLDDSLLLVTGIIGDDYDGPRIHLYDIVAERLITSFFHPYRNSPKQDISQWGDWAKLSVRHDTVAAVYSTSDTLYLFTTTGNPIAQYPIPFTDFSHGAGPRSGDPRDQRKQLEWIGSFDFLGGVHWLADGDFVILLQRMEPQRALEPRFGLLRMSRTLGRLAEYQGVPRLHDVDRSSENLYFSDPAVEAPNRWIIGRF